MTPDEHAAFYDIIIKDVEAHGIKETGPLLCVRHDGTPGNNETKWEARDWEACIQIEKEYKSDNPDITVHYLPAAEKMACIIHKGSWGDSMKTMFEDFFERLKLNGLEFRHPFREICHYGERENPDWSTFVTEVQFPLK